MTSRCIGFVALVSALGLAGCAVGLGRHTRGGAAPPSDAGLRGLGDVQLPHVDAAHTADAAHPSDAGHVSATDAGPRVDAASASAIDASTVTAPDVGTAVTVTGATRCWQGESVTATTVFVGSTCGAIDLVGSSCGRPGAPERYFSALGPMAGGHAGYMIEVSPPEFVIQELEPTEVGFDCSIIGGACSSHQRMLTGSDLTQFMVERGTGGCGAFTVTVTAM